MKRKGKIIMICIIVTILGFNYALTGCQDYNGDYVPSPTAGYFAANDSVDDGFIFDETDSTSFVDQVAGYLWNEMLSLAGPNGRQEVGCYIYRNIYTGEERIGDLKYGPVVSGGAGTNGSITPGGGSPASNGIPANEAGQWMPVGFIHTHTTLFYEENCQRVVGPSNEDEDWAKTNNTTIFTVDFTGHQGDDGNYYIYGGESGGYKVYTTGDSYYN